MTIKITCFMLNGEDIDIVANTESPEESNLFFIKKKIAERKGIPVESIELFDINTQDVDEATPLQDLDKISTHLQSVYVIVTPLLNDQSTKTLIYLLNAIESLSSNSQNAEKQCKGIKKYLDKNKGALLELKEEYKSKLTDKDSIITKCIETVEKWHKEITDEKTKIAKKKLYQDLKNKGMTINRDGKSMSLRISPRIQASDIQNCINDRDRLKAPPISTPGSLRERTLRRSNATILGPIPLPSPEDRAAFIKKKYELFFNNNPNLIQYLIKNIQYIHNIMNKKTTDRSAFYLLYHNINDYFQCSIDYGLKEFIRPDISTCPHELIDQYLPHSVLASVQTVQITAPNDNQNAASSKATSILATDIKKLEAFLNRHPHFIYVIAKAKPRKFMTEDKKLQNKKLQNLIKEKNHVETKMETQMEKNQKQLALVVLIVVLKEKD